MLNIIKVALFKVTNDRHRQDAVDGLTIDPPVPRLLDGSGVNRQ